MQNLSRVRRKNMNPFVDRRLHGMNRIVSGRSRVTELRVALVKRLTALYKKGSFTAALKGSVIYIFLLPQKRETIQSQSHVV